MIKKPNIIFFMADDQRWGELGCYGQRIARTPNIDRLTDNGTIFTHAYAGDHMCAPSRATLLTGKHQGHTAVKEIWGENTPCPCGGVHLGKDEITVAQILRDAGYATGLYGKTHAIARAGCLSLTDDILENNPQHFRFNEFASFTYVPSDTSKSKAHYEDT